MNTTNWSPTHSPPPRRNLLYFRCPFGCGDSIAVLWEEKGDFHQGPIDVYLVNIVHAHEACEDFKTRGVEVGRHHPQVVPVVLFARPKSKHATRAVCNPGDVIGDPGDLLDGTWISAGND